MKFKILLSTLIPGPQLVFGVSLALALWLALMSLALAQGPIYVDKEATGNNDGSSWANAYTDLQSALSVATYGAEIWVAAGVYTPGVTRTDTFTLTAGVQLYGGFAATETLRTQRDWEANLTILSGDIEGNDITDANGVVTNTANISGVNSYHVIWADGVTGDPITETTVLDGFIITAGQANDADYPGNVGGGFYCYGDGSGNECSPTVSNIIFSSNAASFGGAMVNDGSTGGASNPRLSNITFSNNSANDGGAMFNSGFDNGTSSPTLSNVTFSGNTAINDGGAMFNDGSLDGTSSPYLNNVTFSENVATFGGAIFNESSSGGASSPNLSSVTFSGNAANFGGAMFNDGENSGNSSPTLSNVTFSGNSAIVGGAMFSYGENSGNSSPSLNNVTFSGNSANDGGAMVNSGLGGGTSNPSLNNVILWGNTATVSGTQLYNWEATVTLSYTLIQSDANAILNDNASVIYGPNILTGDPLFADPVGTDGITGTLDDDLRLSAGSPAIDAGDNNAINEASDLDGYLRFFDDPATPDTGNGAPPIVDMGAYEFGSRACPSPAIFVNQAVIGGSQDGTSWANAYTDLQDGLSLASLCAPVEIWVAAGVYTPGITRTDTFTLTAGIQLYGGFAATETLRTQRDWTANPTILSGDIEGNDVMDGNGVVTNTANITGTNSYHVVYAQGITTTNQTITETTILDGFTITAGQANSSLLLDSYGGGFHCAGTGSGNECSPSLSNMIFSGNAAYAGGAMYNGGTSSGTSSPNLSNVTFSGNTADFGGALLNDGENSGVSSPNLNNVTFLGNGAFAGGAMFNNGIRSGISSPSLSNAIFSGNAAIDGGGAMGNDATFSGTSSPSLNNVTFFGNSANSGGAMASAGRGGGVSNPSLNNVILWGNTATVSGTQLANWEATPILSYTLIQSDTNAVANDNGGVTYGPNILTGDPLFINPAGADGITGTLDDDLRLNAGSPAIDAGDNDAVPAGLTTDLDGNPRFFDNPATPDTGNGTPPIVDMGAYEWQGEIR